MVSAKALSYAGIIQAQEQGLVEQLVGSSRIRPRYSDERRLLLRLRYFRKGCVEFALVADA